MSLKQNTRIEALRSHAEPESQVVEDVFRSLDLQSSPAVRPFGFEHTGATGAQRCSRTGIMGWIYRRVERIKV